MQPPNDSLEQSYESLSYDSSLEAQGALQTVKAPVVGNARHTSLSPFRYNKLAFLITGAILVIIIMIGITSLLLTSLYGHKPASPSNAQRIDSYAVGKLSNQVASSSEKLQIGQANQLAVNGQLQVSNTLVISPTTTPSKPLTGQIYYNQNT